MRKLRRGSGAARPGRAAVIVPNGTLFGDGVCARIKEQLLTEFDLHTIVRLPNGVFAPYTNIPTNLLFFARGGPTKEIWYYQVPLPEGRKTYTKTKPMKVEEYAPVLTWWKSRKENGQAWKVPVDAVLENNFNLDIKNPNAAKADEHREPEEIVAGIVEMEQRIIALMQDIRQEIGKGWSNAE
jgi:type I restriction enzyme M protein